MFHVIDKAALLQPHWLERHPLLWSCPTPPLFFFFFHSASCHSTALFSTSLLKSRSTLFVSSLLFQLTAGIFVIVFYFASSFLLNLMHSSICDMFEAESLVALLVVWTTQTSVWESWVGGWGMRRIMGLGDLPVRGCRLELRRKSGALIGFSVLLFFSFFSDFLRMSLNTTK